MMKQKNKRLILTLTVLFCLPALLCNVSAESLRGAEAWYFRRNTDHTQPKPDARLSFIEKYNCVYVDKSHADDDADKVLYLTFDAGYENGNVEKILDTMAAEGVKGTFFILENLLKRNPELCCRMAEEGHTVANHTMKHKDMSRVTEQSTFKKEMEGLETLYREVTGHEMAKLYRPPEGRFSEKNLKDATELGYRTVFWSFAYADWDNKAQPDPAAAKEKILSGIHNGAILLLHPTSATNAAVLGDVIRACKAEGYRFETVDKIP